MGILGGGRGDRRWEEGGGGCVTLVKERKRKKAKRGELVEGFSSNFRTEIRISQYFCPLPTLISTTSLNLGQLGSSFGL